MWHVDCVTFLKFLPLFLPAAQLLHLPQQLRTAIEILQFEAINAASALEVRFGFSDSILFPLAVLLKATAIASGMPAIFYIDTVHGLINSLFHRCLCVNLGEFPESRSRYWFSGTGNVGDGNSPAVKPLVALLDSVLEERSHLCVGAAAYRFHYQQSGTTAAAVDKLRLRSGETDVSKFVDLTHFYLASHVFETEESIVASLSETEPVLARYLSVNQSLLDELWPHVLADTAPLQNDLNLNISDAAFTASVQFMHRRYLRGQSILAVNVGETSWLRSDAVHLTDQQVLFLRILAVVQHVL
ncbi:unnamed protein product [Symbiodinium sp. CCMP2592]|nr:unnamed protein product [Symbiodinium sp. CCMP2592]